MPSSADVYEVDVYLTKGLAQHQKGNYFLAGNTISEVSNTTKFETMTTIHWLPTKYVEEKYRD